MNCVFRLSKRTYNKCVSFPSLMAKSLLRALLVFIGTVECVHPLHPLSHQVDTRVFTPVVNLLFQTLLF